MKKIAVIGGGPAGIFAAYAAALNGVHVDLFEHNEKLGKKLFITGKGRCNVTNKTDIENFFDNIPRNNKFLYSALYTFTNENLIDLIEDNGVSLKVERGNRVFPKSDKSSDIIKAFQRLLDNNDVTINLNQHVSELLVKDNTCIGIKVNNQRLYYDAVVLCSGGISYRQTGSDGSGFKLAKNVGHTVTTLEPALVGVKTTQNWTKEISGLTLKNVGLKLLKDNKVIYQDQGEALCTHTGISGPIVLSASSFIDKPYTQYKIIIDLKPALSETQLDKRILRDFEENLNKEFKNSLNKLLPKNLIPIIIELSKIPPTQKVNTITKEQRTSLINTIKNLTFNIKDLNPIEGAIITKGGINTKELDPTTMQSEIIKNLFFAGEIIDVNALTGGFNIQIACSTGYLAGMNAALEVLNENSN